MRPRHKIGKCKYYPLPKAALIYYFENNQGMDFYTYSDLDFIHGTVEIAGGRHCGPDTSAQVVKSLANSPYWTHELHYSIYKGIGNGRASLFKPSEKGVKYYNKYLKNRKK